MSLVVINREADFQDVLRRYKIIIDDTCYGKIGHNKRKVIEIEPGQHSIYLKLDWCRSNKINFYIEDNAGITFNCGNSKSLSDEEPFNFEVKPTDSMGSDVAMRSARIGARAFFKILNHTKSDSYLWLEVV